MHGDLEENLLINLLTDQIKELLLFLPCPVKLNSNKLRPIKQKKAL
jgi:hypothetical protein